MLDYSPNIPLCYLLDFSSEQIALDLGCARASPAHCPWTSRFCGSEPGACTLGLSETANLIQAAERLVRRHRAACISGVDHAIIASLEALFFAFFDAIERCLDLNEKDCVCSWERRIGHAEQLIRYLIDVARVYWGTGAEHEWIVDQLENLARRACYVSERDGSFVSGSNSDRPIEASAGRLSMLLFDTANDLGCGNWAREDWMWVVPHRVSIPRC